MVERYVVGVDGGSTKTIALVADSRGRILGFGRAGNCCWYAIGKEQAEKVIALAVQMALGKAHVSPAQVEFAAYCITGADWPEDAPMLTELLRPARLSRKLMVRNDAFAALRAGTAEPYGVVVCDGTGTNTAVRAPDGREWAYGFWVDDGGAGNLSRAALRAVLRAEDGRGQPTLLTASVLAYLGYPTTEALLRAMVAHSVPQARMTTVCPLVFEAAERGDRVACDLIVRHGHEMGLYATAGIRRFAMQDLAFDVVLSGSVFKGRGPLLVDTIRTDVLAVAPLARIVKPCCEPVIGAVILALEAAGVTVDQDVLACLYQSQPAAELFQTAVPYEV
jgi:N-acetylglucosamine kinase-like BadF-type ATPase